MGNIVRWFEDFPRRALDLLPDMKEVAAAQDRVGSLSLLIAPSLIVAPYERLQTYARRRNPQADYLNFPGAHARFNEIMLSHFGDAGFWTRASKPTVSAWLGSRIQQIVPDPAEWRTPEGVEPWRDEFWSVTISKQETRWVWKLLRDALSHWNVVNSDHAHRVFHEDGIMERLIFYRSHDGRTWDVLSVPPDAFLVFLETWTTFLARRIGRDMLAASEAA